MKRDGYKTKKITFFSGNRWTIFSAIEPCTRSSEDNTKYTQSKMDSKNCP